MNAIDQFFQTRGFMPHGMCLMWRPSVLWMIVAGNAIIAFSYFVIPIALVYLVLKRRDIGFKWIFVLFGAFILACGITHVMGIITLWIPVYGLEGLILFLTGAVSFLTAVLLWPLMPTLFKIPSPWLLEQANQALKQSNHDLAQAELMQSKLVAIVESTDEAIIGLTLDGIIESWNGGAEQLYGYKSEEVVGKSLETIIPADRKQELEEIIEQTKCGKAVHYLDTERKNKNGNIIPVSITISPIRNKGGEVIGSCSIGRDITEWKNVQKMKNEFISIVSHELRTPLTSIQGSLSLLVAGTGGILSEQAAKLLEIAKNNSERLIRLINDILDVEKIEAGKMQFNLAVYSIDALVKEAIIANQPFAEKFSVTIKLISQTRTLVKVDRDRLAQVLTNLLSNAIKFSPANSEITIAITKNNNKVRVAITNPGEGIPKSFQSRIFQKFSQVNMTTERQRSGTGLGLNISKEIIERLNGTIYFTSTPDKETTFFFELPIEAEAGATSYFKKIPLILICQDDPSATHLLKGFLEENGFEVLIAETASSAKKILFERHVDLLLVDLILPDQEGVAFIKELRKTYSITDLPIIAVSFEKGRQDLNGTMFSILDWIEKPIDLDRLLSSVRSVKEKIEDRAATILHVEDDVDLQQIIANLLHNEANVIGVTTIADARAELEKNKFDLVILDLVLPQGSGMDLFPDISKKHIPIIVFSAFELQKDYSHYVEKALVKSKVNHQDFLETIRSALSSKKEK